MDVELDPSSKDEGGWEQDAAENSLFGQKKDGITGNWRYYDSTTILYFLIKSGNYDKH
jgi:hypothetical protein